MYGSRFLRPVFAVLILAVASGVGPATHAWQKARLQSAQSAAIPAREFSRIVTASSEADGYFRSDNFISNETGYLHILDTLQNLGARGGAYIGVGPEQNFTYIAKIRPQIAFIVDIRRQAVIQHLLFKAIFHLSPTPAEFLSILLSRPLDGEKSPGTPIDTALAYLEQREADKNAFKRNLIRIRRIISEDLAFPLSDRDYGSLDYVYSTFRDEGLNIRYRGGGPGWPGGYWGSFPTLRALITAEDLRGKRGNFLENRNDYAFLRELQEKNRVIPIVGNFAGPKALPAVAVYLKSHGYTVTAFYTSNVEQYLFQSGLFSAFAENVRKLPITNKSLFIRAFPNMRGWHPARIPGHRLTTLLQAMSVFLQDYQRGLYPDYWSLATTHYIAASAP